MEPRRTSTVRPPRCLAASPVDGTRDTPRTVGGGLSRFAPPRAMRAATNQRPPTRVCRGLHSTSHSPEQAVAAVASWNPAATPGSAPVVIEQRVGHMGRSLAAVVVATACCKARSPHVSATSRLPALACRRLSSDPHNVSH